MFHAAMEAIIDELDTGLCLRDIANHWACRCTVPGPGMRQAGEILVRRYQENGAAPAKMIPYPADDRTEFLDGRRNPLEWRARSASLEVVQPQSEARVVCRYADEPLCLVCYSTATPPEGLEAEVVVRHGPLAEADVTEGELRDKLLFTDQFPSLVLAVAWKGGAAGVISDCICPPWLTSYPPVREPEDAPDLVLWTCFNGNRTDPPLFGFNLSARQGRRLRRVIAESSEPVILRATVDAEVVEGSSDFVHAVVPGTDLADEEVWVLAHLSEPGARDNASGCCLSLELARVLTALTSSGRLPPLRRTIRFMHAVEVNGFLPYLHDNVGRLPRVVAGLCVDSVGQDFTKCGGEFILFQSPEQNPSFIDGLLEVLLTAVATQPIARFSRDNYATFPWRTESFWGNDAFISDGFFDIPTPQLSTWPDRYYHSSQDTPDQMSDNTLGRTGAALGAYLYLLATAGAKEARWFGLLAAQDWKRRICRVVRDRIVSASAGETTDAAGVVSLVRHMGLQAHDAVVQAERLAPCDDSLRDELRALAESVVAFAGREAREAARVLASGPVRARARRGHERSAAGEEQTPRRLRWCPPPAAALSEATRTRLAELAAAGGREVDLGRIWWWITGRRTGREIHERLRHGGAIALETVVEYLRLMAGEGVLELAGRGRRQRGGRTRRRGTRP